MSSLQTLPRPRGNLPRRPPVEQLRIVGEVRDSILSGKLGRGVKLPPRAELISTYGVTVTTIQRAMDWLIQDGFVRADATGTYVCETLPCEQTFGIVLPAANFSDMSGNHFWFALEAAVRQFNSRRQVRVRLYYSEQTESDCEGDGGGYGELEHDVLCHCLGGIILVDPNAKILDAPVMQHKETPRIAITGGEGGEDYSVLHLGPGPDDQEAYDRFSDHGCKCLGILTNGSFYEGNQEAIQASASAHGLTLPDRWIQAVSLDHAEFARHAMLLMMANPEDRPDALLIDNDQLVEPATRALKELGLKIPDDLLVVAHCNFPTVTQSHVPALRLGYDAGEILETCVQTFSAVRGGGPMPAELTIPARWAEEAIGCSCDIRDYSIISRCESAQCCRG